MEFKRYETLEFTDDFMFCKVMESEPELCEELTSLVLDRKVHIAANVQKQKAIEIIADGRGIRMDIYFEGDDEAVYNVEMQASSKGNLPKRTRYYQSMIDLDLLERGDHFENLAQSYVVFLCKFDPFNGGLYRYTFQNTCDEQQDIKLGDGAFKVFLNATSLAENASDDMKALLAYLCSGTATSDFTRKLQDRVEAGRNREAWKMLYFKQHSRDETIRREALAEGEKIGEERGIAIGEERGGDKRAAVIAKSMKYDDVPIDIISKHTGLTAEEIANL